METHRVDKPAVRVLLQAKFIKDRHEEFDNTLRENFTECHGKEVSQSDIMTLLKGQLQRFHKLISNDRIWPSEHGFEVIFEKSLFVFEISVFKVMN